MLEYLKKFLIFWGMLILFNGCYDNEREIDPIIQSIIDVDINSVNYVEKNESIIEDQSQLMRLIGEEEKGIYDMVDADKPSIIINEHKITKKEIEIQKAYSKYDNKKSFKQRIASEIRKGVIQSEAIRLGIEPVQEYVNQYIEQFKMILQSNEPTVIDYMKGLEITEQEYCDLQYKMAYKMYQRDALKLFILEKNKDKIQKEADKRNVDINIVEDEYYEKYVDELLEKADIEFFDEEVEKLFK